MSWIGGFMCAAMVALAGAQLAGQAGAPTKVTVIGCLKASGVGPAAEITVSDYRGGPAPNFKLTGEAEQLRLNVNQTVEIVGSIVPGSTAGNVSTLKVEKMSRISVACWPTQK
jgi:hypothetical protein